MSATANLTELTGPLVTALERCWEEIRRRHPDVPTAAVVLASGATGEGMNLGHFAPDRWQSRTGPLAEVLIGAEGLARGPADILNTQLHEAAHGIATTRQIRETSRQGRFHNARFKAIAEEVGLEVARDPVHGWAITSLPRETAAAYASQLTELEKSLVIVRTPVRPGRAKAPTARSASGRLSLRCACKPPRRIEAWPSIVAAGGIRCEACGELFVHSVPA